MYINHSSGPRQRTVSFLAASQIYSHHLWVKLCQKNNRNVSVPSEFAWLQLNQWEKHLKYPSPTGSVLFSASHTFFFGEGDTLACILLINLQFILYSPEAKQGAQSTIEIPKQILMIWSFNEYWPFRSDVICVFLTLLGLSWHGPFCTNPGKTSGKNVGHLCI